MNIAMEATEVRQSLTNVSDMEGHDLCTYRKGAWNFCSRRDGMQTEIQFMQEYVNGQLKSSFGDAFIRGNNGEEHCVCLLIVHGLCSSLPQYSHMQGSAQIGG